MEQTLNVFIDGIVRYFQHTSHKEVDIGSPYLIDSQPGVINDYTAVITISGAYQGCCYFTAPSILLKHLILSTGESDTSEEMVIDATGEVANTLTGNARESLGSDFIISVPKVIKGAPSEHAFPYQQRAYAIPISWKSYKALLGICLASS